MEASAVDLPTVALDLKTFSRKAAGIGRYCIELTNNLVDRGQFDYCGLSAPQTDLSLLPSLPLLTGPFESVRSSLVRSLWALPKGLKNSQVDLTHSMDPVLTSFTSKVKYKRIATIHDMIVWKYPETFTKKHVFMVRRLTGLTLAKADHLIADSDSTKKDILALFPKVKPDQIKVIHLAASSGYRPQPDLAVMSFREKYALPQRYFLSVGTHEPRKNLRRLIAAFDQLKTKSAFSDIALVVVGGKGWLQGELDPTALNSRGIFPLGFVAEEDLPVVYSGALAFVYPSLYEGFGLPLLEAMGCGVPVITSNCSSLPEVAGEAGLYVDPLSVSSIQAALAKIADQPDQRQVYRELALSTAAKFSWQRTAIETEQLYRTVLGG